MKKDYYEILGVSKTATTEEIISAYKKKAMQFHPDRQHGKSEAEKKEAENKFKECSEAAEVLRDPDKRQKYDQFGTADFNDAGFNFGGGGFDPMDFFRKMHGSMGGFDPFENFGFGGGSRRARGGMATPKYDPNAPEDGDSYETGMEISFKESIFGCKKELILDIGKECPDCKGTGHAKGTTPKTCPECNGTGQISQVTRTGMMIHRVISGCTKCHGTGVISEPCSKCNGSKRISNERRVTVTIPAGASDSTRLRLGGAGQCGIKGGRNGDVYVYINVEESPLFKRSGNDIYFVAHIPVSIAILGGKVKIPTLYGYKDIKIEPGTQAGTKLKVANFGVRTASGTGSMIINIIPEIPVSLTADQKNIWENILKSDKSENYIQAANTEKLAKEFYN